MSAAAQSVVLSAAAQFWLPIMNWIYSKAYFASIIFAHDASTGSCQNSCSCNNNFISLECKEIWKLGFTVHAPYSAFYPRQLSVCLAAKNKLKEASPSQKPVTNHGSNLVNWNSALVQKFILFF